MSAAPSTAATFLRFALKGGPGSASRQLLKWPPPARHAAFAALSEGERQQLLAQLAGEGEEELLASLADAAGEAAAVAPQHRKRPPGEPSAAESPPAAAPLQLQAPPRPVAAPPRPWRDELFAAAPPRQGPHPLANDLHLLKARLAAAADAAAGGACPASLALSDAAELPLPPGLPIADSRAEEPGHTTTCVPALAPAAAPPPRQQPQQQPQQEQQAAAVPPPAPGAQQPGGLEDVFSEIRALQQRLKAAEERFAARGPASRPGSPGCKRRLLSPPRGSRPLSPSEGGPEPDWKLIRELRQRQVQAESAQLAAARAALAAALARSGAEPERAAAGRGRQPTAPGQRQAPRSAERTPGAWLPPSRGRRQPASAVRRAERGASYDSTRAGLRQRLCCCRRSTAHRTLLTAWCGGPLPAGGRGRSRRCVRRASPLFVLWGWVGCCPGAAAGSVFYLSPATAWGRLELPGPCCAVPCRRFRGC